MVTRIQQLGTFLGECGRRYVLTADPEERDRLEVGLGMRDGRVITVGDWRRPSVSSLELARDVAKAAAPLALRAWIADGKPPIGFGYPDSAQQLALAEMPPPMVAPLSYVLHPEVRTWYCDALMIGRWLHPAVRDAGYTIPEDTPFARSNFSHGVYSPLVQLEAQLWRYARRAGLKAPIPYAFRYALAMFFYDPEAAPATILCLRCGTEVTYRRAPRRGTRRTLRCRGCAPFTWPAHAQEPFDRGRWILNCLDPCCPEQFVAHGQARFCARHRAEATTPSRRRSGATSCSATSPAPP
jgi:hypothetical protein